MTRWKTRHQLASLAIRQSHVAFFSFFSFLIPPTESAEVTLILWGLRAVYERAPLELLTLREIVSARLRIEGVSIYLSTLGN